MTRLSNIPFRHRIALPALGAFSLLLVAVPSAVASEGHANPDISNVITGEGSSTTHRVNLDGYVAQVYLYTGGAFAAGTRPLSFNFLFDYTIGATSSAYITPVLFEQTFPGIYTVRGIGRGFSVTPSPSRQTIPFTIERGTTSTQNRNYTFGFINAIVNGAGAPILTSAGAVDYDPTSDGGSGIGSGSSNNWLATGLTGNYPTAVGLGTTFGVSNADYLFFSGFRTYSAYTLGAVVAP